MCGLFGVALPRAADPSTDRVIDLISLGLDAEERGIDAAGLALRHPDGTWHTTRTLGPFTALLHRRDLLNSLPDATACLGHTRWATQGARTLRQASPLTSGSILGTHNGDVDVDSISHATRRNAAQTDSQVLFAALATAHRRDRFDLARAVDILDGIRGRAALVWTDRTRADGRIWLARAGLSPLSVIYGGDGALWWASNPAWLRRIKPDGDIRLLHEGSLWAATPRHGRVDLQHLAAFKPTVRAVDVRIAHYAVWRGFGDVDRTADRAALRHRTLPARPSTRPIRSHRASQPSLLS